jgi:hypothetical protein
MALTASHQVSGTYQPSNNDNIWVVTESSTGITSNFNFKFLCDVKNTSGALLTRLKVPIHFASTSRGVFNISKVLSSYTTYNWDYDDTAASGCAQSVQAYNLAFGYEYSTGATSDIEVSTGVTTVSGNKVWNAALHPLDFLTYQQSEYLMASGSTANFLTELTSKRIHSDQKDWLYALHNSAIASLQINFSTGASGTVTSAAADITRFPIGANIPGGIPSGTTSYTITPKGSGGNTVGAVFTIIIDDRCSKYDHVDVFFLNKYGAVESFRFDRVRRDNFTSVKNTFRKNPYALNNSTGTYAYNRLDHAKSDYYNEMTQVTTLNSNFITEEEAQWLKQLINSPRVWMFDTQLIPINVRTSEYEQKYHINDKVFNLTLEVEHSFIDKAQAL